MSLRNAWQNRRAFVATVNAAIAALFIPRPSSAHRVGAPFLESSRLPGLLRRSLVGSPVVYFELAGPDAAQLKSFYSSVFGWSIDATSTIAPTSTGGLRGGIRQDPTEKVLYLGVPDIDAALKQIDAAGGKTIVPRTVVPGVVTFALFSDPAGNRMGLAEFGSYPG